MNEITIVEIAGELVVDSRIIAEQLGVEHRHFLQTVRKHQAKLEAKFGQLRFKNSTVKNSVGAVNKITFAYLSENQAIAVLTLSRNTERVVDLKFDLVEKFQEQKKQLEDPADRILMNDFVSRIKDIEEKNNLGQELGNPWDLTDEQAGQVFGMAFPDTCEEETQPPTLTEIAESIDLVMSQAKLGRKLVALVTAEAIAQAYPELSETMTITRKYLERE